MGLLGLFVIFGLAVGVYSNCGCLKCNKDLHVLSPPGARIKVIYRDSPCTCPSALPYSLQIPVPSSSGSSGASGGRCYGYQIEAEKLPTANLCPVLRNYNLQVQVPVSTTRQQAPLVGLVASTDRVLLAGPPAVSLPSYCQRPLIETIGVPLGGGIQVQDTIGGTVGSGTGGGISGGLGSGGLGSGSGDDSYNDLIYIPQSNKVCNCFRYKQLSTPETRSNLQIYLNTPLFNSKILKRHFYTPPRICCNSLFYPNGRRRPCSRGCPCCCCQNFGKATAIGGATDSYDVAQGGRFVEVDAANFVSEPNLALTKLANYNLVKIYPKILYKPKVESTMGSVTPNQLGKHNPKSSSKPCLHIFLGPSSGNDRYTKNFENSGMKGPNSPKISQNNNHIFTDGHCGCEMRNLRRSHEDLNLRKRPQEVGPVNRFPDSTFQNLRGTPAGNFEHVKPSNKETSPDAPRRNPGVFIRNNLQPISDAQSSPQSTKQALQTTNESTSGTKHVDGFPEATDTTKDTHNHDSPGHFHLIHSDSQYVLMGHDSFIQSTIHGVSTNSKHLLEDIQTDEELQEENRLKRSINYQLLALKTAPKKTTSSKGHLSHHASERKSPTKPWTLPQLGFHFHPRHFTSYRGAHQPQPWSLPKTKLGFLYRQGVKPNFLKKKRSKTFKPKKFKINNKHNVMLKATLKKAERFVKHWLNDNPLNPPEVQVSNYDEQSAKWQREVQGPQPTRLLGFNKRRSKRAIRVRDESILPFYQMVDDSAELYDEPPRKRLGVGSKIVGSRKPPMPKPRSSNLDPVLHPTPILHLLNTPARYLTNLHGHASPVVGTIPKVFLNLLKNFGKNAVKLGAHVITDFTKLKKKPKLLPKRHFKRFRRSLPGGGSEFESLVQVLNMMIGQELPSGMIQEYLKAGKEEHSDKSNHGKVEEPLKKPTDEKVKEVTGNKRRKRQIGVNFEGRVRGFDGTDNVVQKKELPQTQEPIFDTLENLQDEDPFDRFDRSAFKEAMRRKRDVMEVGLADVVDNQAAEELKDLQVGTDPSIIEQDYSETYLGNAPLDENLNEDMGKIEALMSQGDIPRTFDEFQKNPVTKQSFDITQDETEQIDEFLTDSPKESLTTQARSKRDVESFMNKEISEPAEKKSSEAQESKKTEEPSKDEPVPKQEAPERRDPAEEPPLDLNKFIEEFLSIGEELERFLTGEDGSYDELTKTNNETDEHFRLSQEGSPLKVNTTEEKIPGGDDREKRTVISAEDDQQGGLSDSGEQGGGDKTSSEGTGDGEMATKVSSVGRTHGDQPSGDGAKRPSEFPTTELYEEIPSEDVTGEVETPTERNPMAETYNDQPQVQNPIEEMFSISEEEIKGHSGPPTAKHREEVSSEKQTGDGKMPTGGNPMAEMHNDQPQIQNPIEEMFSTFEEDAKEPFDPLKAYNHAEKPNENSPSFERSEYHEAKKSLSELDVQVHTIEDQMAQLSSNIQHLKNSNPFADLLIYENLLKLHSLKMEIIESWKDLINNNLNEAPTVHGNLLGMLKQAQALKTTILHQIALRLGKDNFSTKKLVRILIRLQKFHCLVKNLKQRLINGQLELNTENNDVELLQRLPLITSQNELGILTDLEKDRNTEINKQTHLLESLKKVMNHGDGKIIREEAKILWEINNVRKLQQESIFELNKKISEGQRIRRELKILFDLQKQLEHSEDKQKLLLDDLAKILKV